MTGRDGKFGDAASLRSLTADLSQIASVRRIVLDDGPGRGGRMLAFSTGGGLDFWVAADRSLDIATLSFRGVQLGWQSPAGFGPPSGPEADGGRGFDRAFGGFLVTCGLEHIRQPANGNPLHGRLPYSPARLTAYGEDWEADEPVLFCEGEVVQWRNGADAYRLKRRIEAPIGGTKLRITDRIENIGPRPLPLYLLYHFNLGYPAVAPGTVVTLDGERLIGPLAMPEEGPVPASLHPLRGAGHAVCSVDAGAGSPQLRFGWDAARLPCLQLWRNLMPRSGVLSVEPCNMGRNEDGSNADAPLLAPGETSAFSVSVEVGTAGAT